MVAKVEAFTNDLPAAHGRVAALLEQGRRSLEEEGTYPARMFNDPGVFELEKDRVFAKAWVYLGHESEIPKPGDYVVRYVVDNQFILVRDEKGTVRALHNSCRHRGMQICRAESGNASHFVCPYHGWTYGNAGQLVGVPMKSESYGPKFDRSQWGLRPIPKLGIFQGMIFGCLDPAAPSLEDYLGGMRWYLELMTGRSDGGLEVLGAPQRWVVDADWKLGADNFIGDAYHTHTAHRSMVELGLVPKDPTFAMHGWHVHAGNGHGLGITGAPPGVEFPPYFGLPQELWAGLERKLTPDQAAIAKRSHFVHGTVFPNLSFLQVWVSKDHESPLTPMITFRVWHPLGPGRMEIWSWFLVDRDGPPAYREESYKAYLRTFGISGAFEQDDTENWTSITKAVKGGFARDLLLNYHLGRDVLQRDNTWRGPGDAYPLDYAEFNQRAFHRRWLAYMMETV